MIVLVEKGYVHKITLSLSVLRLLHYLLAIISNPLKEFSCFVTVFDSNKFLTVINLCIEG